MRKSKKNEKSKNLHYGLYFGLFVFFIIFVSVVVKVFDSVKKSKFDGNNFFSIAVINGKNAEIISVSPKDGTLKKLTITGAGDERSLNENGIPYDSIAQSGEKISEPKSFFPRLLLRRSTKSEITAIDSVRLFIYSQQVDGEKIESEEISSEDINNSQFLSEWFLDSELAKEKKNIEITNNTEVSGLGNKFAKIISNMGGNVVLVNSSQKELKKSIIYYSEESYTAEKLSNILNMQLEKKEMNSISDIIINIGEDRINF